MTLFKGRGRGVVPIPIDDSEPVKPAHKCPYCGKETTFTPIKWTRNHWIAKCDNGSCGQMFYAKVDIISFSGKTFHVQVIETYPKYVPNKPEGIPEKIWTDYYEACKCFDVGCFKATVVMCRRVMQNICLDRGAKKKDDRGRWISLKNQLKLAFPQKDYDNIHLLADAIKYFGDYGAHPQDDEIDNVREEDAEEILTFVSPLFDIAYVTPYKVNKMKEKFSKIKKSE